MENVRCNIESRDLNLHRGKLSTQERFQFQRKVAQLIESAKQDSHPQILSDLVESRIDYGMSLEDTGIRFVEWASSPKFAVSNYIFDGTTVTCRGLEFKSGDIILCNRARGSDGMFTTLVEGRQTFAHVAMYALLEKDGVLFPAVVEIHTKGVRAVPLNAFLSQAFSTYAEVYRSPAVNEGARHKISAVTLEIMQEAHGFDIYLDDTQNYYLTCARTVSEIYRRSGLHSFEGNSRYSLKTLPNLEMIGVASCAHRDLLMPDDYSRSDAVELVGVLDNGQFIHLVARALVREHMQHMWQTSVLNASSFSVRYYLNRLVVRIIQKKIKGLSSYFAGVCGSSLSGFPSGPATFIALTPIVEEHIDEAAARVAAHLSKHRSQLLQTSSWSEVENLPVVREIMKSAMYAFEQMYSKPQPTFVSNALPVG